MIDFPTELAQQNTHLMQKENHQRELNDELKDENIMLHKKIQGKPCISAQCLGKVIKTKVTAPSASMHTWKQIPVHNSVASPGHQRYMGVVVQVYFPLF